MTRAGVLLAVLMLGCGPGAGARSKAHAGGEGTSEEPGQLRKVDLEFALGNKPFPLPLLHARVAGVATLVLVDTGANTHILSTALARKAELTTQSFAEVGTDHAGRSIETRRAPHPQMTIEGWGRLPDDPMLVADFPEAVTRIGIGAFVSPQQLATDDLAVVLDFQRSEMRQMPRTEALEHTAGNVLALDPPRRCLDSESPLRGLAYVLHARVEDQDADLLVDTGAPHSDLLASSKPGKGLLGKSVPSKESVYAVSGKVTLRTVPHIALHVGAVDVTEDIDLIPGSEDGFCPRDGVLAMDVLKQCVVVIDRQTVSGLCRP